MGSATVLQGSALLRWLVGFSRVSLPIEHFPVEQRGGGNKRLVWDAALYMAVSIMRTGASD